MINLTKKELETLKKIIDVELLDIPDLIKNSNEEDKNDLLAYMDIVKSIQNKIINEMSDK